MSGTEATTDFYYELARAVLAAEQDRADRADPDLAPLLEARDAQAAAGDFELADTTQGVIDATRDRGDTEHTDTDERTEMTSAWEIGALNEAQGQQPTWEPTEPMDDERLQGNANALQAEQHDMERE